MIDTMPNEVRADCMNCFGLCCVALPYAKSADFAFDKDGGTPCRHLQSNFRCAIHEDLRNKGFRGCTAYDCFGAGQKVSQVTYEGKDWRNNPELAKEMFDVFPVMQQLHEMLWYLHEVLSIERAQSIHRDALAILDETERLTRQNKDFILQIDVSAHRRKVNGVLLRTSEIVRAKSPNKKHPKKIGRGSILIGAKLRDFDLRGANLRGAVLIAADLRNSDLRMADLIGADFRDADLRGADLSESMFLTQAQVNAAKGDRHTKLPPTLRVPDHWKAAD
ncbi:hypothetical protein ACH95_05885 [Bacillus glycinifermentans]|uniref:pentapeptide repeat-containing protein n=1 Tax=Bacillus glycinifermentans TaxID=1664069 RepID=UPI0006542E33|nr:pentapeptide repeat-containing protein [Bacillus glycinifermentans]KMM62526.1 hypothetical protein ACH95_05885 [Bacillus glycinifermentans]MEC0494848.1 pentapeptide repeat-containing protein [Bacillus glycinifermentans]MEC0541008.1 pentapeptide repeat-containing protein [Bacillus glycinifermentans]